MSVGSVFYRWGRIGALTLASRVQTAAPLFTLASYGVGLAGEVTAFEGVNEILNPFRPPFEKGGQGKFSQRWLHSFVNFGLLKIGGAATANQNLLLQHLAQDTAMVMGNRFFVSWAPASFPEQNLAEQFVHAEATTWQMKAGMGLVTFLAPGLSAFEKSLDLTLASRENPRFRTGLLPSSNAWALAGGGRTSRFFEPRESHLQLLQRPMLMAATGKKDPDLSKDSSDSEKEPALEPAQETPQEAAVEESTAQLFSLHELFFSGSDPRLVSVTIPVNERKILKNAKGEEVGEAFLCAGGEEGGDEIRFQDGSSVSAETSMGGRDYQEDGYYIARFTLPDGQEVKIIAGADGAGGMGGGDIASSAFLQGIHASAAEWIQKAQTVGDLPFADQFFLQGVRAVLTQRSQPYRERAFQATGAAGVIVIVGSQATIATAGDAMVTLSRTTPEGTYKTVGHSNVDNSTEWYLTNGIAENFPWIYQVVDLRPGDRITLGSDGFWENLIGRFYKYYGSYEVREDLGLLPLWQSVFRNLNLMLEGTRGKRGAAEYFLEAAADNMRVPGRRLPFLGRWLHLPDERDPDNILAIVYEHGRELKPEEEGRTNAFQLEEVRDSP